MALLKTVSCSVATNCNHCKYRELYREYQWSQCLKFQRSVPSGFILFERGDGNYIIDLGTVIYIEITVAG